MIFNFGSINIDHVYRVADMPQPGETITAISHEKFLGGKGINQSIAIAKAGGEVTHIGAVGTDGDWALEQIKSFDVATNHIMQLDNFTGHAIIYVDDNGENQIVISGGTNQQLTLEQIEKSLHNANPDSDWVLLQNETNLAEEIVTLAKSKGLRIAYAAAPFVAEVTIKLIDKIDLLAVNEVEASSIAKSLSTSISEIPVKQTLITKGSHGCELILKNNSYTQSAFEVTAVDTTGAGDTFLGSFLARITDGESSEEALRYASAASAIQVTRNGAAPAIPHKNEVIKFLDSQAENG